LGWGFGVLFSGCGESIEKRQAAVTDEPTLKGLHKPLGAQRSKRKDTFDVIQGASGSRIFVQTNAHEGVRELFTKNARFAPDGGQRHKMERKTDRQMQPFHQPIPNP
jgi:hypothetical protein